MAWDRGPVRLGRYVKQDGTSVPMNHDSEVAAIAFAIQNIIEARAAAGVSAVAETNNAKAAQPSGASPTTMAGKKCGECGAHAVIKRDGCEFCTNCGMVGSCG